VLRSRLTALVAMAVLLLATAAPAFAARPNCALPGTAGFEQNCGSSLEHRANPSGKGNFGQCHKLGAIEGAESRTFNPSSENNGEALCRTASGRPTETGSGGGSVESICFSTVEECMVEASITFRLE
jgi:hypothetical protein